MKTLRLLWSLSFLAFAANAAIIQFEPPSLPGGGKLINSWTESGFYFTAPGRLSHTDSNVAKSGWPDNGSAYLHTTGQMAIYNLNGQPFSMLAVDLAEYSILFAEPMNVTFTGFRRGGTTVTQSFELDGIMDGAGAELDFQTFHFDSAFTNLDRVESSTGAWHMDNLVVVPASVQTCAPITNGLVSWWRAEDDSTDNWGSNNGTNKNTAFAAGKVGQAFSSPQIRVNNSPSLQTSNALTLEAWVNPSSVSGATPRAIISKFDYPINPSIGPVGTQSAYLLGTTNNGLLFFTVTATGSARTNTTLVTTQALPVNQWSFVVATYDGAALRIYLNGVLAAQTNYSSGIFLGAADLGIGAIPFELSFFNQFDGLLDEVSLYNRALTDAEILAIYNADIVGKCVVAPTIVAQPQDQTIPLGEDVKFTVLVLGSRPLRYQWRFNRAVIADATNSSLVLEKLKTNQAGFYQVSATNAVGFAISARAQLSLRPAPACSPTPGGLISWWPGDTNRFDTMGMNNLTLVDLAPFATGKVDRAFSFNGSRSRAEARSATSLNFGSKGDFSIEMWVKPAPTNAVNANVPLFEKRTVGIGLTGVGYSLSLNQGRLAFWMSPSAVASNVQGFISSGPNLVDAMFHHVAVTVNRGAINGGNLYVDGQVVLLFDPTARNGNLSNTSALYIGGPTTTISGSYFAGLIDEPAIYNRTLTAEEILAIRQAGAAGKCKVKPTILDQPVSQRVTSGSNVTFSVVATGTPLLRYQWLTGLIGPPTAAIPGATNSSLTFTVPNFFGSFALRVTNLFGSVLSSNAVLTINNVPTALAQMATLNEDTPAVITLSGNDRNNDPLVYSIVTSPAHGNVSGSGSNIVYTPSLNYNGSDSFTFKVNDGLVDSAAATVSITVLSVNDPPVAQSQSVTLDEDSTFAITLGAFDVENDSLTFVFGLPAHGTLTATAPNLVYHPATNYFGPDSFTFKVNDGLLDSDPATIYINVRPVNDAPVAKATISPLAHFPDYTNLLVISLNNSNATVVFDGSQSTDVENDPLQYAWMEETNVLATGVLATNILEVGTHLITLLVSDGMAIGTDSVTLEVITAAQSVGILILDVNQAALTRNSQRPLIATLKAAAVLFEKRRLRPGINQLGAFQNKVRAQITPQNSALADNLISSAQVILDALSRSR